MINREHVSIITPVPDADQRKTVILQCIPEGVSYGLQVMPAFPAGVDLRTKEDMDMVKDICYEQTEVTAEKPCYVYIMVTGLVPESDPNNQCMVIVDKRHKFEEKG